MEGDALPEGGGLIGGRCPARMGWPDRREMPCQEGELMGGRCPAMNGET